MVLALNGLIITTPVALHAATTQVVCDSIKLTDPNAPCDKAAGESAVNGLLHSVLQTLVFIVGTVSVLVIVIGALMYVTSGGDPNNTKRAKDAILYAIIGIIVALLAQGIVSFVLTRIG